MYYYGYNGGFGQMPYYQNPCPSNAGFVGYTTNSYSQGAALWIVLFVLLVIIIGAGFTVGGNTPGQMPR